MSKKRALVLALVLLPLAVGGGIIASLAKGSRSLDVTGLEAPANADELANTDRETPAASSPRIEPASMTAPSDQTLSPMQRTPARQAPNSGGETITIDSDQATSEPLFASTAFTPAQEEDELPAMGAFGRSALYTLAGRAHGGGGGSGGGTSEPSGNTDTGPSPDNTSKNPTGSNEEDSSRPSSDEPTNQGSTKDESSETKDEGDEEPRGENPDEPTGENPPPIFFPPTDEPSKPVQVPEPASLALLGLGLLGCALARRKTVK